ncbi:hypothetical protein AB0I34_43625 [Kribbella sp. NPDC050281]|uniref:hypothetical protein n=1 Tax=Kribbella sp. NPDC050281 TaxID=3155515 RepID=UPI0033DC81AA
MRVQLLPRLLGLLTLGYGAYTAVRPESLVRAAGLADERPIDRSGRVLGTVIGVRDVLSGTAMLIAPAGRPLQAAVIARVACDLTDVAGFGLAGSPRSRGKVVGIAGAWGLLCAAAFPASRVRR